MIISSSVYPATFIGKIARRFGSEYWASALDEANQDRDHGQDEQNVNESTQGVRADHTQQPED
jgi:hypothetical protein